VTLDASGIQAQLLSHAQTLGIFENSRGHEPKNAPGLGLNFACWVDEMGPIPSRSGLAVTSALLVFNLRVYNPMTEEPQDEIDPRVLRAVDALMGAYTADFDLGGSVEQVDLLGAYGPPLKARAGYLQQDGKVFRTMVITIGLVVDDLWTQSA
jgi:hypothetical protein